MAKTKHDFVQLTKSYCKQNKTFLDNTTVTDYLGSGRCLRLNPKRGAVEGGGPEAPGLSAQRARSSRPSGTREFSARRAKPEQEQAAPPAYRRERREQAIPLANQ